MAAREMIHGYVISPIDFWNGCQTFDQYMWQLGRVGDERRELRNYAERFLCAARCLAPELGWEGDIREGPYVFLLPHDGNCEIGIAWKQENNGTTFVFAPVALPWLESHAKDNTVTKAMWM